MCNDRSIFVEFGQATQKVTLGDGSSLQVAGQGTILLNMILTDGTNRWCSLKGALHVPQLAYNLVSVSRATEAGKTVHNNCEF